MSERTRVLESANDSYYTIKIVLPMLKLTYVYRIHLSTNVGFYSTIYLSVQAYVVVACPVQHAVFTCKFRSELQL